MFYNNKEVKVVNIMVGFLSFLDFLFCNVIYSVVLFGYYIKQFDVFVFFNVLLLCEIVDKFVIQVDGFVDMFLLFKLIKLGFSIYFQINLFKYLLNELYEVYDVFQDVIVLQIFLYYVNFIIFDKVNIFLWLY